jgi:hypothetical protein
LGILAWVVAVATTWRVILCYQFRTDAAQPRPPAAEWPLEAVLPRDEQRPTMVLFMHPKCPCTQASLAELEHILPLQSGRNGAPSVNLLVVATVPSDGPPDWLTTSTIQRAEQVSARTVFIDRGGKEAQRFGATTSGTLMWFASDGRLRFAGGITAGRGHEGDNAGRRCVEGLMRGNRNEEVAWPAFGCRLCLPES